MLVRQFLCDWDLARQSHGLEKLIIKNGDRAAAALVAGGAEEFAEVDEVRETLWKFHKAIYGAFDYYAALIIESTGTTLECDVFSITFNGFLAFVRDCRLATKGVSTRDLETTWVQVNAFERKVADLDKHNQARTLNRQEFLQLLVHIALTRYVRKGKIKDFSDAVEEMIRFDVITNLPAAAMQNSDLWRRHNCYNEHVDIVLRKHLSSLQNLYGRYSEMERDAQNKLMSDKNMSIGEWLGF
eukprot:2262408-Prymnesium_polylepis.2